MSIRSIAPGLGSFVLWIVGVVAIGAIAFVFIYGGVFVADKVLPILTPVSILLLIFDIIILGPIALFKLTRSIAAIGFLISSFVFGLTGWLIGLVLTWTLWGVVAVFIGLFMFGIGVVPIAMVATLSKGMWGDFSLLVILVILTFGLRALSLYLATKHGSNLAEMPNTVSDEPF